MNESAVRIAVCIKDRIARQLTSSMFGSVGATVLICEDTAAIQQAGDKIQAIVLGLTAAAEETIDAVVMLRQRLASVPIYVVADSAGQRHAKRIKTFGVAQVIPHGELQQKAGPLVQQLAQAANIENWGARSPAWAGDKADQGYDVESMDLGAWLSVPENQRLLRNAGTPFGQTLAPSAAPPQTGPEARVEGAGAEQARAPASPPPAEAPRPEVEPGPARPLAEPAPEPEPIPKADANALDELGLPPFPDPKTWGSGLLDEGPAGCGLNECSLLRKYREEHDAQHGAILEAHQHREKRLKADLKSEVHSSIAEQIAASEALTRQLVGEAVTEVKRELAAAVFRLNLAVGGLLALVVVMGIFLAWRSGTW